MQRPAPPRETERALPQDEPSRTPTFAASSIAVMSSRPRAVMALPLPVARCRCRPRPYVKRKARSQKRRSPVYCAPSGATETRT
jgi:hypothetical protein